MEMIRLRLLLLIHSLTREPTEDEKESFIWEEEDTLQFRKEGEGRILRSSVSSTFRTPKRWSRESVRKCNGYGILYSFCR